MDDVMIRRVLVLEDHDATRAALVEALGRETSFVAIGVATRAEALAEVAKHSITLALVDLRLGDERGSDAIRELVARINGGWSVEKGKLHREFRFADFTAAFGFMTKVAIEANTMDHHPEFFNVWNKVVIDLVTHEADDSISNLDVKLAHTIDKLAK